MFKKQGGICFICSLLFIYELNIAAEVLNYAIVETLDTMIHEMVHLYCRENGIKETSRGGTYHNGEFEEEAEKSGLECFKRGQYGWNTKPSEMLVEYALSKDWNEIRIPSSQLLPIPHLSMGRASILAA